MDNENLKGYVIDSISLLKEQALKAKQEAKNSQGDSYNEGMVMAYCCVISLLKHQATVFNIDQQELGLSNIDPENDLIGLLEKTDIESSQNQ